MKLWQQPPQQLPVKVRPLRLETLTSYATRLAAANELARPTTLIRALGHPHGNLTATTMHDYDLALNPLALAQLETFTGIPTTRLRKSLPAVNHRTDLPGDLPRTRLIRCWDLRPPCDGCAARVPGTPTIRTYQHQFPPICVRHRRWLDGDKVHSQIDLTKASEIITAHRRYLRLHDRIAVDAEAREWFRRQLFTATEIVKAWVIPSRHDHPRLHQTWTARPAAVHPWLTIAYPSDVLVFPEAVALAEIITDLNWRRHVTMVQHDIDLKPFFNRVATRLGQPRMFAIATRFSNGRDPLRHWVNSIRRQHEATRIEYWQRVHRHGLRNEPFPEIRHFE